MPASMLLLSTTKTPTSWKSCRRRTTRIFSFHRCLSVRPLGRLFSMITCIRMVCRDKFARLLSQFFIFRLRSRAQRRFSIQHQHASDYSILHCRRTLLHHNGASRLLAILIAAWRHISLSFSSDLWLRAASERDAGWCAIVFPPARSRSSSRESSPRTRFTIRAQSAWTITRRAIDWGFFRVGMVSCKRMQDARSAQVQNSSLSHEMHRRMVDKEPTRLPGV